jgi:ribonuclease HI
MRGKRMTETEVEVFTDGACIGNPGPGGWAALLRCQGRERWLVGHEVATTNNRMEMMAAIAALEALKRPSRVSLTTDSQYLMQGAERWLAAWKARGWRTAARQPVLNQDLWMRLDLQLARHEIAWTWCRGHNGHPENEQADVRARDAALLAARELAAGRVPNAAA